jgi:hypothetical protein
MDDQRLEIEPTGESTGYCDCCGSTTKRVWGFAYRDGGAVGAYFLGWAERRPDHGASIELILGNWGETATRQERYVIALDCRIAEASPQFMLVDAEGRLPSADDLASVALKRSEVVGTPLAPQVFALVDAIYLSDPRIEEVRNWSC